MKKAFDLMKKVKKNLSIHMMVVIVIAFALFVCFRPSSFKIGVVDMNRVYSNAEVFKSIREEQQILENDWKRQALAQKRELEEADKALSKKKGRMKRSKFDKEVSALKERILDFQNQQMAKLDLIRYQIGQITLKVEETMKPIIEEISHKKKIEFVLSASNALYYSRVVDITDDVIKQLNEAFEDGQLSSLQISLSEGE